MKVLVLVLLLAIGVVRSQIHDIQSTQKSLACLQNDPVVQMEVKQCFQKKFMSVPKSDDESNVASNIKQVCAIVDPTSCLMENILRTKCFTEEQAAEMQKTVNIIIAGYNYVCEDDGAKITEFMDSGGPECVQKLFAPTPNQEMMQCIKESMDGVEQEVNKHKGNLEKQEEIGCKTLFKMKDCILNALDCPNETPAKLLDGLFRAMIKESPCWQYMAASRGTSFAHEMFYLSTVITMLTLTVTY